MARRSLLSLLALAIPLPALAAAPDPGPAAPIDSLYQALLKLMHVGTSQPFTQRFQSIAPVIERVFNLTAVLKLSIGPRWDSLDKTVQAQLLKAFRDFTVATYVANFDSFEGEQFKVLPEQRAVGAERVVETQLIQSNGKPVRLDYLMRQGDQGWQVVDVLMDGTISKVAVQRSDFRSLLTNGGAPALIASLERKAADLSGGALKAPAKPG